MKTLLSSDPLIFGEIQFNLQIFIVGLVITIVIAFLKYISNRDEEKATAIGEVIITILGFFFSALLF